MPLPSYLVLSSRACLCRAGLCPARVRESCPTFRRESEVHVDHHLPKLHFDSSGHLPFWFLDQNCQPHSLTCASIPCSASSGGQSFSRGPCGIGSHLHGPGSGTERSGNVFVARDSEHLLVARGGANVDYWLGVQGHALGLGLDSLEAAEGQAFFAGRSWTLAPEA